MVSIPLTNVSVSKLGVTCLWCLVLKSDRQVALQPVHTHRAFEMQSRRKLPIAGSASLLFSSASGVIQSNLKYGWVYPWVRNCRFDINSQSCYGPWNHCLQSALWTDSLTQVFFGGTASEWPSWPLGLYVKQHFHWSCGKPHKRNQSRSIMTWIGELRAKQLLCVSCFAVTAYMHFPGDTGHHA